MPLGAAAAKIRAWVLGGMIQNLTGNRCEAHSRTEPTSDEARTDRRCANPPTLGEEIMG